MELNQVTLPCTDYEASVAFYTTLGLRQIVDSPPRYARFETETGSTLSIHAAEVDSCSGATVIYFEVENVDETVARLRDKGLNFDSEPTDESWLWREAHLSDPAGNRICIFHAGENRRFPPWRIQENRMDIRFETARLYLRPVTVDDAALMLAVWNDPAFKKNVADRGIRTLEQAREAIAAGAEKLFADYGYGPYCLTLKSNGELIGICGLFRRDNLEDPDIGFSLLPDYRGQGYAGEAAIEVVRYARDDLGIPTLNAIVSPHNKPSIGLIEKLGLRFERMLMMPGDDAEVSLYSMAIKN